MEKKKKKTTNFSLSHMFIKELPILSVKVLKISNKLHSRSKKLQAYNVQKYHFIVARNVFPHPRGHDVFLTAVKGEWQSWCNVCFKVLQSQSFSYCLVKFWGSYSCDVRNTWTSSISVRLRKQDSFLEWWIGLGHTGKQGLLRLPIPFNLKSVCARAAEPPGRQLMAFPFQSWGDLLALPSQAPTSLFRMRHSSDTCQAQHSYTATVLSPEKMERDGSLQPLVSC